MMTTTGWAEITGSAEGLKLQLAKIGSRIFSDDYINSHPPWRRLILASRKGYVHLHQIALQQPFQDCLLDWNIADSHTQQLAIYYSLAEHCSELIVNMNQVRRVNLYRWDKLAKPILLDRLEETISLTDVRQYLGEDAFSEHEVFEPQPERSQYIYAPSHRRALKQIGGEFLPFKVVDYFGVCKERERESRFWEQHEMRRYSRLQYEQGDRGKNRRGGEEWAGRQRVNRNDMQEERYDHGQAQFECTLLLPNPQLNALLVLAASEMMLE